MYRTWQGNGRVLALGVVLGVIGSAALGGWRGSVALAQPTGQTTGASETMALTATTKNGDPLLYVVDTKEKAFAVYRVDASKGSVKLEAARPYKYDLKLEYNNLPPEVAAIESLIASPGRK